MTSEVRRVDLSSVEVGRLAKTLNDLSSDCSPREVLDIFNGLSVQMVQKIDNLTGLDERTTIFWGVHHNLRSQTLNHEQQQGHAHTIGTLNENLEFLNQTLLDVSRRIATIETAVFSEENQQTSQNATVVQIANPLRNNTDTHTRQLQDTAVAEGQVQAGQKKLSNQLKIVEGHQQVVKKLEDEHTELQKELSRLIRFEDWSISCVIL